MVEGAEGRNTSGETGQDNTRQYAKIRDGFRNIFL